jgi:fibronectin-binding autotransporter adhesin
MIRFPIPCLGVCAAALLLLVPGKTSAQMRSASGLWGAAGDWTPAVVPDSLNAVATLVLNGGSLLNVDLSATTYTVSQLQVNGSGGSWTVANGTLNFVNDTDGDAPIFSTQSAGGGVSVTVLANIILTNNTIFTPGSIPTQVAGNITGGGGLLASGPGPLLLSGISTYTGVTVVDGGPLQAGSSTAFSSSSSYGVSSVLDLNGFSNSIGTLIGGGTVTNTGPGVAILTVGAKGTNFSFFGNLEDGGVGSRC